MEPKNRKQPRFGSAPRQALRALMMPLLAAGVAGAMPRSAGAQTSARPFTARSIGVAMSVGALTNEATPRAVGQDLGGNAFIIAPPGEQKILPETGIIGHPDDPDVDSVAVDIDGGEVVGQRGGNAGGWLITCQGVCDNSTIETFPALPACAGTSGDAGTPAAVSGGIKVGSCLQSIGTSPTFAPTPIRWRAQNSAFVVDQLQTSFFPQSPFTNIRQPGVALDVNSSGTIVGSQGGVLTTPRACIFRDNQDPLLLPANLREARGISDNGFVTAVGTFTATVHVQIVPSLPPITLNFGNQTRGFIRQPNGTLARTLVPLDLSAIQTFTTSETHKINSAGSAVGFMKGPSATARAMIWNAVGARADLTAHTAGLPAGTVLTDAVDINDNGDVLAFQRRADGNVNGFILKRDAAVSLVFASSNSY
jgi:hypothetical protein